MVSVEAGLNRLERLVAQASQAVAEARHAEGLKSIMAGTATLSVYADIDGLEIKEFRRAMVAYGALLAVEDELGFHIGDDEVPILLVPPGQPLTPRAVEDFEMDLWLAQRGNVAAPERFPPWFAPPPYRYTPEGRRDAATVVLAMGLPLGEPIRRALWVRVDDHWQVRAKAARAFGEYDYELKKLEAHLKSSATAMSSNSCVRPGAHFPL